MTSPRWRWAMVGSVLFVGAFGAALGDVIGTSGLVATGGPSSLLGLWLLDAIVALTAAGAVGAVVDRVDRTLLTRRIVTGCAATALLYAWLVGAGRPAPLAFVAVAVGERLQNCVIYYTAWALARDAFGADVTKLARLRVLSTGGQLLGASLAGSAAAAGISRVALFVPLALMFLAVERVLAAGQRAGGIGGHTAGASSIPPPAPAFASLHPTAPPPADGVPAAPARGGMLGALRYFKESRNVRYLGALGVLNGVGYTILAFELAKLLESEGARDVDVLQARYGLLRALEPLAYVLAELFIAPRLVKRIGMMPVMAFTPCVLLAAVGALLGAPRSVVGIVGSTALQASFGIEAPALSAAIASLPRRIRGRVGVLLDSTPYTFGYIVAVALLGSLLLAERMFGLGATPSRVLSCCAGVATSVAGLLTVQRLLRASRAAR